MTSLNNLSMLILILFLGIGGVTAQNVTIPDANFKAYLVGNTAINTNSDAEIQVSEAVAFTGKIDCYYLGIMSFTGLEAFINLTELDCSFNYVNSLDLTQNTNLEYLDCSGTSLPNVDVTANIKLKTLYCTSIATVSALTSLDVTNNVNLEALYCDNNSLIGLDLSENVRLEELDCYGNFITSLDLSLNRNLVSLSCFANSLTSLNIKNTNNINFTYFDASINPNLTCIEVDDTTYSSINWASGIDATASFSLNCSVISDFNSIAEEVNLAAYPNPTRKDIKVDFGKTYEEVTIQITNVTGQVALSRNLQNSATASLELEGAAGIYFVRIQTEAGTATLKVIKE